MEEKADPSLAPGTVRSPPAGVSGYRVKVWRVFKEGGKVKRRGAYFLRLLQACEQNSDQGPEPEKETVSETVSEEEI